MKKIFSVLVAMVLCFVPIFAQAQEVATPYYLHIRSMAHLFDIDEQNSYGLVDAHITIKSGASCSAKATVQREINGVWRNVIAYTETGTTSAMISEDPYLSQGYKYKCVFTFTVYDSSGNVIEQKTFTSQEVDYR